MQHAPVNTEGALSSSQDSAPFVLVVDDDDALAEALAHLIESRGYAARRCADAFEALEQLRTGRIPDLILLDLRMPHMDGWEFRLVQRSHPAWASIPVIALSGDKSAKAKAIDADAQFSKPIDEQALLRTMHQLVSAARRQRSERELRELERLRSLGALTAGLAHNLNNPLSLQLGYTAVARRACGALARELGDTAHPQLEILRNALDQLEQSAQRMASAVQDIANFARPGGVEELEVSEVLEGSVRLLAHHIRHRGRLERAYQPVPRVRCCPAKLGQLFLDLLTRALHVLDERRFEQNVIALQITPGPEHSVQIRVSDTGAAVSTDRMRELFGAGSDAGDGAAELAVVQRLVWDLGGSLSVESEVLSGTTITVTLPGLPPVSREPAQVMFEQPGLPGATRPRLLIVDDEPGMCELLRHVLEDTYDVEAASDPRAVLARLRGGQSFDLILCDLMMPGLSGMALHDELARVRPELAARMVFMTGGTFSASVQEFVSRLDVYLRKPFEEQALRALIAQKLAEHGGSRETVRA